MEDEVIVTDEMIDAGKSVGGGGSCVVVFGAMYSAMMAAKARKEGSKNADKTEDRGIFRSAFDKITN